MAGGQFAHQLIHRHVFLINKSDLAFLGCSATGAKSRSSVRFQTLGLLLLPQRGYYYYYYCSFRTTETVFYRKETNGGTFTPNSGDGLLVTMPTRTRSKSIRRIGSGEKTPLLDHLLRPDKKSLRWAKIPALRSS